MADAVTRGYAEKITEELNKKGKTGFIETFVLQEVLTRVGMVPVLDTQKVTSLLEHDHKVEFGKLV
jgi:hypothetical protein